MPTRIYLTGFMGSGKSTAGPLVARRLGYAFVDLDDQVEARTGRTIPALFEAEGEEGFRRREARLLEEVSRREETVIALGGGALLRPNSYSLARARGEIVFLDVPVDVLAERLKQAGDRPLLAPAEDLRGHIARMMRARRPVYSKAHHQVAADASPEVVAARIAALWPDA